MHARALDGSAISGSWFGETTKFAERTSWLNAVMVMFTSLGLTMFTAVIIAGRCRASRWRHRTRCGRHWWRPRCGRRGVDRGHPKHA